MKLCAETRTAIVPQGGNTGLCGGAVPDAGGRQIVLKLSRMNRIRELDALNNTMTVEAGCVLADLQQAAADADRLFPLSLAAEGSCEIGGNLSTNAGGIAVLRYGNARDLVLGLEVVLPDGQVWDGLRGLRKDNTGYDLKQLFIGAEGTLGVITAAVLKLYPRPRARPRRWSRWRARRAALRAAVAPAGRLRRPPHRLRTDVRLLPRAGGQALSRDAAAVRAAPSAIRAAGAVRCALTRRTWTRCCRVRWREASEAGVVLDAVVAASEAQAAALWALRENIPEAQVHEGKQIKHDVSVPISRIAEFIAVTDAELQRAFPGVRMVCFGHLGDGNLHYNVAPPAGADEDAFMARAAEVSRMVHDSVARFAGSISAEHGLGQYKRGEILRYKSPLEMDLMRRIKAALDPQGIMNPGKVL